nr:DUF6194 family protein [Actinomadura sp. GC306]
MSMEELLEAVRAFDGVHELAPAEGDGTPETVWGDHFFYYAPDGTVPARAQPYATIVTKDQPGDALSDLGPDGRWRVNIHVGRARYTELTGEDPGSGSAARDFSAADVVLPHPVYGTLGWVAVVNPGERTGAAVVALLREAHEDARRRAARRAGGVP